MLCPRRASVREEHLQRGRGLGDAPSGQQPCRRVVPHTRRSCPSPLACLPHPSRPRSYDLHVTASAGTSVTDRLGAGVDPDWLAQRSARTGASGSELGDSDLSSEYSPRSSDASPSARRCEGAARRGGGGEPRVPLERGAHACPAPCLSACRRPAPPTCMPQHPAQWQPPHLAVRSRRPSRRPLPRTRAVAGPPSQTPLSHARPSCYHVLLSPVRRSS